MASKPKESKFSMISKMFKDTAQEDTTREQTQEEAGKAAEEKADESMMETLTLIKG